MKKIIVEESGEGLIKLLGKKVTLFCMNYIYTGELIGVNESCVLLKNPAIVYETGAFTDSKYKDCQSLNVSEWYVSIASIESFGVLK